MNLTEGRYLARAIPDTLQFGRAKTGMEQVALTFRILDGETQKETNQEITWIGAMGNEKSLEITAKAFRACGCDNPESLEANPSILGRNVVELVLENDTYNGKTRLRVSWVNVPGGGRFSFKQELDAGSKTLSLSKLKGVMAKEAAGEQSGSAQAAAADDLPF